MSSYSDFLLINDTHQTIFYDLSFIVTTVVDSLGKSAPIDFLVAPSEHSDSITRYMKFLKLARTDCCDHSSIQSRSIMTDEGSALVKVLSNTDRYHHCLCTFHINQLTVRVSSQIIYFILTPHIHTK